MRSNDPFSVQGLAALTLHLCMKIRDVILRGMYGQFNELTHLHRKGEINRTP